MAQPVLHTERLLMVPLDDRHLDLEVELDADPEVLRFLWGRARTRDEVVASHAERMALTRDGLGYWMAFRKTDDALVGLMMLPPVHGTSDCELGYRLARRFWRQGFAAEASRALLGYAFDTGQSRVIAQTMAVNAGSRGVMEKVGMRYVRTFFPTWDDPLPGSELGEVEYEMTREMWGKRSSS
ncbi:GNAT family N-acetyltransferase [Actinoplanes sp. NPDC000266]